MWGDLNFPGGVELPGWGVIYLDRTVGRHRLILSHQSVSFMPDRNPGTGQAGADRRIGLSTPRSIMADCVQVQQRCIHGAPFTPHRVTGRDYNMYGEVF